MALNLGKNFHHDLVRPGIALYGGHLNTKMKTIIKPVVTLKGKILQIKEINKNKSRKVQFFRSSKNVKEKEIINRIQTLENVKVLTNQEIIELNDLLNQLKFFLKKNNGYQSNERNINF